MPYSASFSIFANLKNKFLILNLHYYSVYFQQEIQRVDYNISKSIYNINGIKKDKFVTCVVALSLRIW